MFQSLNYAYITADILLVLVWLLFYLARKDLRREMLMISLFAMPLGLTQYFFMQDYWRPAYVIGFGFLVWKICYTCSPWAASLA